MTIDVTIYGVEDPDFGIGRIIPMKVVPRKGDLINLPGVISTYVVDRVTHEIGHDNYHAVTIQVGRV